MKLILNSDVKSLGRKGDVVDVAKGYARNYLLPKKLAVVANSSNLKFAEALREKREIQAVVKSTLLGAINNPTIQVKRTKDITLGFIKLKKELRSNAKPSLEFLVFILIWLKLLNFR